MPRSGVRVSPAALTEVVQWERLPLFSSDPCSSGIGSVLPEVLPKASHKTSAAASARFTRPSTLQPDFPTDRDTMKRLLAGLLLIGIAGC